MPPYIIVRIFNITKRTSYRLATLLYTLDTTSVYVIRATTRYTIQNSTQNRTHTILHLHLAHLYHIQMELYGIQYCAVTMQRNHSRYMYEYTDKERAFISSVL